MQGHTDEPLNEQGELQAREIAEHLKGIEFSAVYSSPLKRAHRTIEMIVESRGLQIVTNDELKERRFGPFEGKFYHELDELNDAYAALPEDLRRTQILFERYEPDGVFLGRIFPRLGAIASNHPGENVLVGSHAGIIRILLAHYGVIGFNDYPIIKNSAYLKLRSLNDVIEIAEMYGVDINSKH